MNHADINKTSTIAGDKGKTVWTHDSQQAAGPQEHKSNAANKLDKVVRKEAPPSQAGAKLHYRQTRNKKLPSVLIKSNKPPIQQCYSICEQDQSKLSI
ncbi:hypothetical protein NC652_022321 [Populus alba x Populus x berolinensis]|nr:hypothetical protein NC652_022321 [Populus alba x Populus x berolinensis]